MGLLGSARAHRDGSSGAHLSRTVRLAGEIVSSAKSHLRDSTAQRVLGQLKVLEFADTIVLLGAALLVALLPFVILMGTFVGHNIDADLTRHVGLNPQGSRIMSQLFESSPNHSEAASITGFVFALAGTIGVGGLLRVIYERAYRQPHSGVRDLPRSLTWVIVLAGVLIVDSIIGNVLRGAAGRPFLDGLVNFAGVVGFFVWSMHFLLRGKVPWKELLPSAIATGIFWIGLAVFASFYFSSSVVTDSRVYGTIGVVFSLATWLMAVSGVIVLGAAVGSTWSVRSKQKAPDLDTPHHH